MNCIHLLIILKFQQNVPFSNKNIYTIYTIIYYILFSMIQFYHLHYYINQFITELIL